MIGPTEIAAGLYLVGSVGYMSVLKRQVETAKQAALRAAPIYPRKQLDYDKDFAALHAMLDAEVDAQIALVLEPTARQQGSTGILSDTILEDVNEKVITKILGMMSESYLSVLGEYLHDEAIVEYVSQRSYRALASVVLANNTASVKKISSGYGAIPK
jgi:hypothetical protein